MMRNDLLKQLSAVKFAMWDLHLYLDTHPCDTQAVILHNKYMQKACALKEEFEEKCYKLSPADAQGVEWIRSPWPWDKEGCDC